MPPKLWHWDYFRLRPKDLSMVATKDYHGSNRTFLNAWCKACIQHEISELHQQDLDALEKGQITHLRTDVELLNSAFQAVKPVSGRREGFEPHIRSCEFIDPHAKERLEQESTTSAGRAATQASSLGVSFSAPGSSSAPLQGAYPLTSAELSPELQKRFESDLCKMFVANGYAWNSVNQPETQKFFKYWVPGAKLPDRRKLSGPVLQSEVKLAQESMRNAVTGHIATGISDGWKNIKRNSLIATLISVDYTTYTVEVHDMSALPKTADEYLKMVLRDIDRIEKEYGTQIIAWVSDAGGDSRAMRVRLQRKYPHLLVFDCWAHQINLIVSDILHLKNELVRAADTAIDIIKWIINHSRLLQLLHEEQLRLTSTTHTLTMPAITRWTSHFLSFNSLLTDAIPLRTLVTSQPNLFRQSAGASRERIEEAERIMKCILDQGFWSQLAELKSYLEPLAIAANVSQAPTTRLDHILIELGRLYYTFALLASHPDIRRCVLESLERRWGKCDQDAFILAVLFNPFIRARLFNPRNTLLNRSGLYSIVKRMYARVFRRKGDIKLYEAFLDYYASRNEFSSNNWDYEELREVYENAGKPVNLVNIWSGLLGYKTENTGRHQLTYLAIHILSIVANSAGCERLFSEMGFIHTKRRNRLSYQKVFDTAVVRMELKRQHAALGLTRNRLRREFGTLDTHPEVMLPAEIAAEKDQRDETAEEVAEVDMLDEDQAAYNMVTLAAKLRQDTINDEDPATDDEAEDSEPALPERETRPPKQPRAFFGTQNPILLKDLFDYSVVFPQGQGLDSFMHAGVVNLQKELEIYDLATRDMIKSILPDAPPSV